MHQNWLEWQHQKSTPERISLHASDFLSRQTHHTGSCSNHSSEMTFHDPPGSLQALQTLYLPEGGTRLTVALHLTLTDDGFLQMCTLFGWKCLHGFSFDASDNRLLDATTARFAAWRESNNFPWKLSLSTTNWRHSRVALRTCSFEFVIWRRIFFARWKIVNFWGRFFGWCQRCGQKIFVFDAWINLLWQNLNECKLCLEPVENFHRKFYHQMNRLKERSGTRDPFSHAVTSPVVMSLFEIFIESVVFNCCASDFIRSTWGNRVISIDDVHGICWLQGWEKVHEFD